MFVEQIEIEGHTHVLLILLFAFASTPSPYIFGIFSQQGILCIQQSNQKLIGTFDLLASWMGLADQHVISLVCKKLGVFLSIQIQYYPFPKLYVVNLKFL